ncbi:multifunctional cellulase [Acanthamoeba castellanii str. Neff]|uniref:endo-1,4-beta-xylanase n=1 Tax=Acanthamoeba castellanii (strain ATCC 30010 / Neff) TaxID=1257118 RepID=L8GH66_ACACF|nr:multifunctional cellulase [Acanthamoeba castellanii str. Neff]ELR12169.1 multifunctional cellulase [Acanthamoeba castellanii str. Neff]
MANPDRALTALEWLANASILMRGHNLLWPSYRFMPPAAQGLDAAQLDAFIRDHFANELNPTRGQCYQWDVINEPNSNYDVQVDGLLSNQSIVEYYKLAQQLAPSVPLFLNDFSILASYNTIHCNYTTTYIQWLVDQDNQNVLAGSEKNGEIQFSLSFHKAQ